MRLEELSPLLRLTPSFDSSAVRISIREEDVDNILATGSGERSFLKYKVVIEFYPKMSALVIIKILCRLMLPQYV